MKPKIFRDTLRPVFIVIEVLIFLLFSLIAFFSVYVLYWGMKDLPINIPVLVSFELIWFGGGTLFCILSFRSPRVLDRAFGRLLVYPDRIVYKCIFRIRKELTIEECRYVGVEDYQLLNRGIPVIRGDEVSFVYFSILPYPQKYKGKISCLKNKKGFIKISYSDRLAEELFNVFPEEKCTLVRIFHAQMQENDRALQREPKKRKKKRK